MSITREDDFILVQDERWNSVLFLTLMGAAVACTLTLLALVSPLIGSPHTDDPAAETTLYGP